MVDSGCVSRQRGEDTFIPRHRPHTNVSDALNKLCGKSQPSFFRVPFGVKRLNAACGVMITGSSGVDVHG